MTHSKGAHPPRQVWISYAPIGDAYPIGGSWRLTKDIGHEHEFIPLSESDEREAKAKSEGRICAYEDALSMALTRRKSHNNSLEHSLRLRLEAAREGKS